MAWVFAKRHLRSGTVVDWRDVMVNVNNMAKEWNGLWDRDNMPESFVTRARIATSAFNDLGMVNVTTMQEVTAGSITGWFNVDELVVDVDAYDGSMVADAWVQFEYPYDDGVGTDGWGAWDHVEMRLCIGNTVVSESGWCSMARRKTCLSLQGYSPTGSGTVRLQVQVRAYRTEIFLFYNWEAPRNTALNIYPTQRTLEITRGALVYRHTKR